MTVYKLALLFLALTGAVMAMVVYLPGRRDARNISLAAFNLAFSIWCSGQFMGETASGAGHVLFWTRVNLAAAILLPVLFLTFVHSFLGISAKRKPVFVCSVLAAIIFLLFLPTKYFIVSLARSGVFRYYPQGGPLYLAFAVFFAILVAEGFIELIAGFIASTGAKRNQIAYLIIASLFGFGGGALWFLPAFGVPVYPFGVFIVPFYLFIAAYSIVKHGLLDIRIVIRKGLVYSIVIALSFALYILALMAFLRLFRNTIKADPLFSALLVLAVFSVMFDPLRVRAQKFVDRYLFRGRYDYQDALKNISLEVAAGPDSATFFRKLTAELGRTLGLPVTVAFIDRPRFYSGVKETVIIDRVADGPLKTFMNQNRISAVFPMIFASSVLGHIVIGESPARDIWNDEDVSLMSIIASQAAVAAKNAMLFEDVARRQFDLLRSEKLALVGTMAASLAHEIKNPLTSLKGLAQVLPENREDKEFIDKFADIVPRQILRIDSVVEKLLASAKQSGGKNPEKEARTEEDPAKATEEILFMVKPLCEKNNIEIIKDIYPTAVRCGREQLMQVILNLVMNAIEAMPSGGTLRVRISDGCMTVSDSGAGIDPGSLERIFESFYSTKEGGTGLGLSTVYRIIKDMGWNIDVRSLQGQGTSFEVRFN